MTGPTPQDVAGNSVAAGHDDYALQRVPQAARYPWLSVATQRFGQLSALSQFLLGAALGFGMSFWDAFLALTLGAVVLEAVAIAVGIAGQREGLSTSMLARWTGFGRHGSALLGLAIAVSLVGWFGIQSQVSGRGLHSLLGVLPEWGWSLAFGLAVTVIAAYGFRWMAWTAYLTVPALLALAGWSVVSALADHSFTELLTAAPAGPPLSIAQGTVLVAGGFILGGVVTPDMARYNRSAADVVKQTVVGITLGEYVIGLAGVLLALAIRTNDVVAIVTSTSGVIGTLVIIAATLKINDWNLYSGSLGVVNFAHTVLGRQWNRAAVAAALGVAGSVLAAAGILESFQDFLILLGVAFPPVAGIMAAEYFIVRASAGQLAENRDAGGLPDASPTWAPAALGVWLIAALVGKHVTWGLGSVNALLVAFVLYVVLGKLGLMRPLGRSRTEARAPGESS